jgi:hypothetical protein
VIKAHDRLHRKENQTRRTSSLLSQLAPSSEVRQRSLALHLGFKQAAWELLLSFPFYRLSGWRNSSSNAACRSPSLRAFCWSFKLVKQILLFSRHFGRCGCRPRTSGTSRGGLASVLGVGSSQSCGIYRSIAKFSFALRQHSTRVEVCLPHTCP